MSDDPKKPESIPVDMVKVDEPWATAYLPDGSRVRVKLVFTGVTRSIDEGGKPAFASDGRPELTVMFNWVIDVQAPASAMKQKEKL